MRRLASIAAAFALTGGAAFADDTSEGFKDWAVVCDNTRVCSAFGFSPEGDEVTAFLRLDREADATASPKLSLSLAIEAAAVVRLSVDGAPIAGLEAVRAVYEEGGYAVVAFSPAEAKALMAAMRSGDSLSVAVKGKPVASVSLAGASATLRWMDDRQKRAGTVTALVATGPKPATAVPSAPPPPMLKAAPAAAQTRLPKAMPPAVKQAIFEDAETDEHLKSLGVEPIVARLAPGVILWGVACSAGAYNVVYCFYLTDEAGGSLRPAAFAGMSGEGANTLMNADFDPKTQTLSNFDKGRGIADCGADSQWVWDGKLFQLADQTLMPTCRGVTPGDWPISHRTAR